MRPERTHPFRTATRQEDESQDTPVWVVAVSALPLSLLLGLCCYLLLKL
jgi:hypothetical protein